MCPDNRQYTNPAFHTLSTAAGPEFIPLRADHGRRDPSPGERRLRPRPPGGDRAGQLPPDHRRLPGAPQELPQPGEDRTVRLPADHTGRDQETQDPPAQHQSPRLLRPGDPPALGGRQPTALLQMLHHPMTLEPRPGKLRLEPHPWNSGGHQNLGGKAIPVSFARASEQGWGALQPPTHPPVIPAG